MPYVKLRARLGADEIRAVMVDQCGAEIPPEPWHSDAEKLCRDCRYYGYCQGFLLGTKDDWVECDWTPSRWTARPEVE